MRQVIGYTTGVYDLFHIGHLRILQRASEHCDSLIVGVTTDALAERLKGRRPVIPLEERMEIVNALSIVDRVVPQEKIDEIGDWERLRFDRIFKGDDWQGTEKWQRLERHFQLLGVEVVFFPYTLSTSSAILREVLKKL
ncbi:MAG: adenylyltransferase/cytidyltransferase family protein [Pseudomonadota bacterium]